MKSVARYHFPHLVIRQGEKVLWNPIQRKTLKNRPEERVRLRVIEFLLREAGWPKTRIATEQEIELPSSQHPARADIVCYSKDFDPEILIECKSENVALTNKTAEQIAHYNRTLQAPYLLLTNGVTDLWFQVKSDRINALSALPSQLQSNIEENEHAEKDFSYWTNHGFAAAADSENFRRAMQIFLKKLYDQKWKRDTRLHYLTFNETPGSILLDHYYIVSHPHNHPAISVAIGCMETRTPSTRLAIILSQQRENIGLITVDMGKFFAREKENTTLYSAWRRKSADASDFFNLPDENSEDESIWNLPEKFYNWFVERHGLH